MVLALLLLIEPGEAARRPHAPPPPPAPPKPDGWWAPGRDPWSVDALRTSLRQLEDKPAPSAFLGEIGGLARGPSADWAWFAEGFDPDRYATVSVAPPRNGMGRYELVGEQLLRDAEVRALREVTRAWRKADVGTDGELVVYTHLRWALTSELGVAWVVENLGVDADKKVVFRAQYLAGAAPPGAGDVPDARTRFAYLAEVADEAGAELGSALTAAGDASRAKTGPQPGAGPPAPLHVERSALVSPRAESFGPALAAQIAEAVAAAQDASAPLEARIERVTLLGHLGAAAGVPVLCRIILETSLDPSLRAAAVWAAGEIGHPNALPTLEKARGVDPYLVRTAITKIDLY
ncbi:MAG: HEAT repeat domain-containing protein [Pseudomonadota bacterium]|nr:HEAT repeat domain-containing protein [Pseudomonadota bacterium]